MEIRNIVYLYTEIMPYQTIVYKELSKMGFGVHAFYNDKGRQTPFKPEIIKNVFYYPNSIYSPQQLLEKVQMLKPEILVVCGWSSSKYMYVAKQYKKAGEVPVVCPIDTQYIGRWKQRIGFLIAPFYIKRHFTHIWVPGVRQYYFARRMGYKPQNIILNSLTGNVNLFKQSNLNAKNINYPKSFLYVGRYHEVKGLHLLMQVWDSIKNKKGWRIICAGNGPLKEILENRHDVEVLGFQSQTDLVQLSEKCGAFILPSNYEPWALVLQEFAAAGLPILCSTACGASPHFVINGYNGAIFKTNDFNDLKSKIEWIMSLSDDELRDMSNRSRTLSKFVNPQISAASLLSVIYK